MQSVCMLHNFLLTDSDIFIQEMEAKVQKALEEVRDLNVSGLAGVSRV